MFIIRSINLSGGQEKSSELIHPTWAYEWDGFQVFPTEYGVTVALWSLLHTSYVAIHQGMWIKTAAPVFYSPATIREHLAVWSGGMRIHLRWSQVEPHEAKVSYHVAQDSIVDFLTRRAIPQLLASPVRLGRKATLNSDKQSVALPSGVNLQRVKSALIAPFDQLAVKASVDGLQIQAVEPVVSAQRQVMLVMDYEIRTDTAEPDENYQVVEYPCVVVRPKPVAENLQSRRPLFDSVLRFNRQTKKEEVSLWGATVEGDQPVTIRVLAESASESGAIATELMGRITKAGMVSAPPFALDFEILATKGLEKGADPKVTGGVATTSFELHILGIPEGELTTTITT